MTRLRIEPLNERHWDAITDLFGRSGASNGCWCMYWRIGPTYRERPRDSNRAALRRLVRRREPMGLLALVGEQAVAWCALAPRAHFDWLERRPGLRDGDGTGVWAVPCFYVRAGQRGHGLTGRLVDAAVETAQGAGADALEAYPVRTREPGRTANLFTGTAEVFERRGFETVGRLTHGRVVMRRQLEPPVRG